MLPSPEELSGNILQMSRTSLPNTRVFKMLAWQAAVASASCFHLYTEPCNVALVSLELAEIHLPLPESARVKGVHHIWLLCCFLRAGLIV